MTGMKLRLFSKIILLVAVPALLGPSIAQAQGTAGAASLNIPPGARADGMGSAHAAVVNDGTSGWWNPAALGRVDRHVFSLMHTQLVPGLADDVYYEYLGYAQHLKGWGGIGASFIFLTYGESIATSEDGDSLGTFSSYELSPAVSAGTELIPSLYAGVTLKFVYVYLAPSHVNGVPLLDGQSGTGNTFGADVGVLYEFGQGPFPIFLGAVFQNLGPDIAYIDEDQADPLGRNLKLGLGAKILNTENMTLLGVFDFNKPLVYSDEEPIYNVGAEWAYGDLLALRAGYYHDHQGDIMDWTFGFGLAYKGFSFDYASRPQAEGLNRVSKFSLNYRF